ncbi:MAG: hypothetical protein OHK0021_23940 [Bryobacter sp.]
MIATRRTMLASLASFALAQNNPAKTRNLILITQDGLRWQDVFRGADEARMPKKDHPVWKRFWRDTPRERRAALMPFLWNTVAQKGQIFGNRDLGADAYLTNGLNFSFPGYSEILTGFVDKGINSNDKIYNPNVTVLEWLHQMPEFRGKVAAFAAWDAFPWILNDKRAGFLVNACFDPFPNPKQNTQLATLSKIKEESRYWGGEAFDAPVYYLAQEYLKQEKPRVLYIALGESDEWGHEDRYDLYLHSAHLTDLYARQIWDTVQAMPEYRDQTTLLMTVDHGRGDNAETWKSHGEKLPESKYVWIAAMGPDTPALGERKNTPAVTSNQLAATMAALLGKNYSASQPKAGRPIADLLAKRGA